MLRLYLIEHMSGMHGSCQRCPFTGARPERCGTVVKQYKSMPPLFTQVGSAALNYHIYIPLPCRLAVLPDDSARLEGCVVSRHW